MHIRNPWIWGSKKKKAHKREWNILQDRDQLVKDMKDHGMAFVKPDGTRVDPKSLERPKTSLSIHEALKQREAEMMAEGEDDGFWDEESPAMGKPDPIKPEDTGEHRWIGTDG